MCNFKALKLIFLISFISTTMKKFFFALYIFLTYSVTGQADVPMLIPQPQQMWWDEGTFELNTNTVIVVNAIYKKRLRNEIQYLSNKLSTATGFKLSKTRVTTPKTNYIYCTLNDSISDKPDFYALKITPQNILIEATSNSGVFYAVQTLLQLFLPPVYQAQKTIQTWQVPCGLIVDYPKFAWRGLLLDCSRHFMEKDFIKRYIDLLAYHKMNVLHWHITEDQGWRITIDSYPKLTEIGAWRKGEEGEQYGGFYSKATIKEIVAYAAKRHITVVPEIELPGHCQAALAAYPAFSCTGGPFEVETEWGVFKEIYCAGNEETFHFLETVLMEVMELFPSKYIHIGGDEVPKYRWERCAKCKARMKTENLPDTHALQSYFIQRIAHFLQKNNRILIGWDEIMEGGLAEGAIVQSWRGFEGAKKAAEMGHYTIVSPTSHAYFDYDLKAIDVEKVYAFNPIPSDLPADAMSFVLGGECNMWSERAPQATVDSKVFPRLLAMTEVLWTATPLEERNYSNFYTRMQYHYQRLDAMGVDYGFETVPVSLEYSLAEIPQAPLTINLQAGTPDLALFYTLDGTKPNINSTAYTSTFTIDKSVVLQVQAYKNGQTYGDMFSCLYNKHLTNGIEPILTHAYSQHYTGGGNKALSNGLRGSLDFRDGHWQGIQYNDVIATFNTNGITTPINSVKVGCYQYNNSWIFLPTAIVIETSSDGQNFVPIAEIQNDISPKKRGQFLHTFYIPFDEPVKATAIRVRAKNIQHCPDWHEASGSKAWLFIDEIIFE